jgi:hypothetical protein
MRTIKDDEFIQVVSQHDGVEVLVDHYVVMTASELEQVHDTIGAGIVAMDEAVDFLDRLDPVLREHLPNLPEGYDPLTAVSAALDVVYQLGIAHARGGEYTTCVGDVTTSVSVSDPAAFLCLMDGRLPVYIGDDQPTAIIDVPASSGLILGARVAGIALSVIVVAAVVGHFWQTGWHF